MQMSTASTTPLVRRSRQSSKSCPFVRPSCSLARCGVDAFYGILSEIGYCYRRKNINSQQFHVIEKGILYLEEDKDQDLSVKEIAALCNVSEIYFRRLFKQYAGMSPVEYKLHSKLLRAKQYLASQNFTIREVAELSGFEDAAYFCKVFKAKTGLSPRAYRLQNHPAGSRVEFCGRY